VGGDKNECVLGWGLSWSDAPAKLLAGAPACLTLSVTVAPAV
jgi:hypothetical protein